MDQRDAIWKETHELRYNVSYTEEIERALLARWTWVDSITKIAVAISSASSALAGLVFWKNSAYTFLWPLFTSVSALLAIISKQLSVAEKLSEHASAVAELSSLSLDIETLIVRMKINSEFVIADFEKKLLALRARYRLEISKSRYDLLLTRKIRAQVQLKVDAQEQRNEQAE